VHLEWKKRKNDHQPPVIKPYSLENTLQTLAGRSTLSSDPHAVPMTLKVVTPSTHRCDVNEAMDGELIRGDTRLGDDPSFWPSTTFRIPDGENVPSQLACPTGRSCGAKTGSARCLLVHVA